MAFGDSLRNGVDWVVGLFSAKAGAKRAHFRRLERDYEYREAFFSAMRARGYRAAREKAGNTPWAGSDMSADGELIPDLRVLRAHQRELERDDPLASGLARTFRNDVVGDELRAQSVTPDADLNRDLEDYWNSRRNDLFPAIGLPFGAVQRLIYAMARRDGGVLIKRTKDAGKPAAAMTFEVVELDRLRPTAVAGPSVGELGDPEGWITEGIEKDRTGKPVAYWISEHHPRDIIPRGKAIQNRWKYIRVPAEDCIHYRRNVDRAGQSFGVPDFYAISQDLKDIDLLVLASLKRSQIAACMAAFIKSDQGIDDLFSTTARRFGYELDQQIEPGMIFALYPGEDVHTLIPNFPTPELVPFIVMLCRRVGAAVGVGWEVVLGGFGDSNYSAARTVLLEARKTYGVDRHDFVEGVLRWIWRNVMEDARLRGAIPPVDDVAIAQNDWHHQGYQWIDPQKEANATKVDLETGIRTLRQVLREKGIADWRDHIDQKLEEELYEQEQREALGLPSKVPEAGPAQGAGSDMATGPDKDEPEKDSSDMQMSLTVPLASRLGRVNGGVACLS